MARTDKKVRYSPTGKLEDVTPDMAARGIESAFRMLEGRWKMVIIFHLFARGVLRFSELERAIPAVSQKMLIQVSWSGMELLTGPFTRRCLPRSNMRSPNGGRRCARRSTRFSSGQSDDRGHSGLCCNDYSMDFACVSQRSSCAMQAIIIWSSTSLTAMGHFQPSQRGWPAG